MKINAKLRFTTLMIATALILGSCQPTQADKVNWTQDVEGALTSANNSGQLVLMKFTADWCGYCKKMERETFTRPAVAQTVNTNFVPVLVDADKHKELVRHLKIRGLPAILVVSPEMVILSRISGYQTEAKLLPQLKSAAAKFQQSKQQTPAVAGSNGFVPVPTRPVSQQSEAIPNSEQAPSIFNTTAAPQQPAVFDPPAFGGLCLPSVNETRSIVSGTPQFATKYHGKTLYFRDAEQMKKFTAKPDQFWPMSDGNCPVTQIETKKAVEGKIEYAAMFRGKLWLTSSAENMKKFVQQPAAYVDALPKK